MNQPWAGNLRRLLAPQQFILALLGVILLAWIQPDWGAVYAPTFLDRAGFWGVCLVFFLYGLKLSPQQWKAGLRNTRLHILIQGVTFLLFPLLALAVKPLFGAHRQEVWLAVFFLCALPSTVSSSVVMVSIARGNVPGAILNAGISSLAGIIITPLWMSLFLSQQGEFNTGDVFLKLFYQVVAPVIAGQLLHRWWGGWAAKNARWLKWCDQTVILLIVYNSFCDSFYHQAFSDLPGLSFFLLLAGMLALFWIVYGIVTLIARQMQFSREDRIAAQFCGSKKSLVHGTVMSSVLFAGHAHAGLFLLPVMMYHALQLIVAGWLAGRNEK
jgi:solute carrier family 10 (sodium/bile acid cotransporter), member 7